MSRLLCGLVVLAGLVLSTPPALAEEKPQGKKIALLVGVKDYDHNDLSTLKHTENDVEELAKILQGRRGGFKVVVMTSTRGAKDAKLKPTAANIRAQLKALLEKITKHDLVIIGLAGHGLQMTIADPKDRTKEKDESFFCPADARPRATKDLAELTKTMIPLLELFKELQESGAGVKLLFVDACRNDAKAGSRNIDSDSLPKPSNGTAALFSCKGGERAFETDKLGKGHGVFFHHIIEGLKGKAENDRGEVNWSRLVDYVVENVSDQVPTLIGGGARQTPQEIKNIVGKSPILLGQEGGEAEYQKALAFFFGIANDVDEAEAAKWFEKAHKKGHPVAPMGLAFLRVTGLGLPPDRAEAERLVRAAAARVRERAVNGDANAANWLGTMIREGIGLKQDFAEAIKWFKLAAAKGELDAMDNLGNAYLAGQGVEADPEEALKWYRKAAEKGLPSSMTHLGEMHLNGTGVKMDEKEAVRWARKAAEKGEPGGMLLLADCYYGGQGVVADDKEALAWYNRAAKKGYASAQVNLGWMYATGRSGKRDYKEALRLFQLAIDRESTSGMTAVAFMYENGHGVEQSDREAVRWYRKAADKGDPSGMESLGNLYESGLGGLKQDEKEAVRLYKKAADKGLSSAMTRLGRCYSRAVGVEKDNEEAVRWFKAAAKKNDPDGTHELAYMYETASGVEKDEAEAARLYRKAADRGVLMSLNNLALLHIEGRGVKTDDDEAFKLLKRAAEKGLAAAQNNLAYMYEEGKGTKQDRKQALAWYKKAAAQGHEEAKKKVKELEKKDDF